MQCQICNAGSCDVFQTNEFTNKIKSQRILKMFCFWSCFVYNRVCIVDVQYLTFSITLSRENGFMSTLII